jgi:hypothetical protein
MDNIRWAVILVQRLHWAFELGLLSLCNVKESLSLGLIMHHDVNEYGKVQV